MKGRLPICWAASSTVLFANQAFTLCLIIAFCGVAAMCDMPGMPLQSCMHSTRGPQKA